MANPEVLLQFPELLQQHYRLLLREYNWYFRGGMCVTEASHSLLGAIRTNYTINWTTYTQKTHLTSTQYHIITTILIIIIIQMTDALSTSMA